MKVSVKTHFDICGLLVFDFLCIVTINFVKKTIIRHKSKVLASYEGVLIIKSTGFNDRRLQFYIIFIHQLR